MKLKEKIKKEYLGKLESYSRQNCLGETYQRNTLAVLLVRYSGPFLKWTREELVLIHPRTRELITMPKALHPRDDIDRLYV